VEGLQRLVLTFKPEGVEARALYKTQGGPGPSTKARRREVVELATAGLREALAALEGGAERVDVIGTSGFDTREDTIATGGRAA
jgi:hypothetical protein